MASSTTTKAARKAAREAVVTAQADPARRNRANMDDLAVFLSARQRADQVDDWLTERVAALKVQADQRRAGQLRECGVALRAMKDRGESVRDIARRAGISEKTGRELFRSSTTGEAGQRASQWGGRWGEGGRPARLRRAARAGTSLVVTARAAPERGGGGCVGGCTDDGRRRRRHGATRQRRRVVGEGKRARRGVSQPLRLLVDAWVHAEELARFETLVVRGPGPDDCAIWVGAIGGDGYGRFWVRRGCSERIMVRANRYALAAAQDGVALEPSVRALHGCDNTVCVRVSRPGETGLLHMVGGSQRDNMEMMGRARRGGGRPAVRRGMAGLAQRRARAVALRRAVRDGWDAEAVAEALLTLRGRRCGDPAGAAECAAAGRRWRGGGGDVADRSPRMQAAGVHEAGPATRAVHPSSTARRCGGRSPRATLKACGHQGIGCETSNRSRRRRRDRCRV